MARRYSPGIVMKQLGGRRWRLLLVLFALVLAATALVRAAELLRAPVTVGENRVVNDFRPIDANNSPSLALNPRDPDNIVVTYRVDRPAFSAALEWSDDRGAAWRQTPLPLPEGMDRPFAPDVAFAPDGTLYVTYVNLVGNGNVPDNLWIARSSDGGRSLSPPVRVAGRLSFQGRVVVGHDGTVHVTWLQANEVGLFRLVGSPNPIVASRSTDGARSFSAPVPVSDPGRERVGAATPVVDSRGQLVVLYQDFKGDRRDFEFLEGPAWPEPVALVVSRSDDGGISFSPGLELESEVVLTRRFLVFLPEFPSLAAGADGALYVAWSDGRNDDSDVFLRRSGDGGRTWDPPALVNDNRAGDGTWQYLPRVDVADSGRVDVVFLDRRRDRHNVMTDAFLASSDDGGRSFRNVRLTSKSFDSRVGPYIDSPFPVEFGSRLGIVSTTRASLAAWTDTRFGDEGSGRQDIVFAEARHRSTVATDWAVVTGLAVAALACGWGAARPWTGRRNAT